MNARQRRTVARAKDARRPWGRAVERERRKAKRARYVLKRTTFLEVGRWVKLKSDPNGAWYRVEGPPVAATFCWDRQGEFPSGVTIIDHPEGGFAKFEGGTMTRIDFDDEGREVPYQTRDGEATILD